MSKQRFRGGLLGADPLRVKAPGTAAVVNLSTTPTVTQSVDQHSEYIAAAFDFNADGSQAVYFLQNGGTYTVDLSTNYDLSTAGSLSSVYYLPSSSNIYCYAIGFSNDGKRVYGLPYNDQYIYYWPLQTDYDVTSAQSRQSATWPGDNIASKGVLECFNDDGTKFFVLSITEYVYEYALSTAYDLTTMSYTAKTDFRSHFTDMQGTVIKLDSSGLRFAAFDNDSGTGKTKLISLTTAYDFSTASVSDFSTPQVPAGGCGYAASLGRLYYAKYGFSNVPIDAVQLGFTPGTAEEKFTDVVSAPVVVDPTTAPTTSNDHADLAAQVNGLDFNGDGTEVFLFMSSGGAVKKASLSTAYDVSTMGTISSHATPANAYFEGSIFFSVSGDRLYRYSGGTLYYWNLSTAYDCTSAGSRQSFSWPGTQILARGHPQYNADGTKVWFGNYSGTNEEHVFEYSLSTAYDLTTATYQTSHDFSSSVPNLTNGVVKMDDSGLRWGLIDQTTTNGFYPLTLTTAYDFSTGTVGSSHALTYTIYEASLYAPQTGKFAYVSHPAFHSGTEYWLSTLDFAITGGTTSTDRTTSNVGIVSLDEAGPEANGSRDLTQINWGGIRGRDAVTGTDPNFNLENTGVLSLSEALQVQYGVPALSVGTWWTLETPLNSQWSRDGDYEASRTGSYGGHGICIDTEVTSGKYYAEFWWDLLKAGSDTGDKGFGLATNTSNGMSDTLGTQTTHAWIHYASNGKQYPPSSGSAWGSTMSNGDVVGVAVDYDNGKVWTHVNGTWSSTGGDPSSGGSGHTWTTHLTAHPSTPARIAFASNGTSGSVQINGGDNGTFGGNVTAGGNTDTNGLGDFKYSVPTGFQGLYDLA